MTLWPGLIEKYRSFLPVAKTTPVVTLNAPKPQCFKLEGEAQAQRRCAQGRVLFGTDVRAEFIQGVAKIDDRFIILLDVNKMLSNDELAALIG